MVIAETGTPVYYRRSLEFDFQKNSHSRAGKDNQDFRITCQAGRELSKLWSRKIFFLPLTCSLRSENQLDDLKMLIIYSI